MKGNLSCNNGILALTLAIAVAGCASAPKMESDALIAHIKRAYTSCYSYVDTGSIAESESGTLFGKNVSHSSYSIQFVRERAFRLELHAKQSLGVAKVDLVYFWDGTNWSSYDSLELERQHNPVTLNLSNGDLDGPGIALTHGLFPDIELLLGVIHPGFYDYTSKTSSVVWFRGHRVYRLTLSRVDEDGTYNSAHEFWIDPKTFVILKDRFKSSLKISSYTVDDKWTIPDHTINRTRRTVHDAGMNVLAADATIDFRPPNPRLK